MIDQSFKEVIFVGIPGPTHHYGGLSQDNVASSINRGASSSPKEAALQALDLVRLLRSLGCVAAVLPPQLRPHMALLRQHFEGQDEAIIRAAAQQAPGLLEKASSSSAMWTANAATVAPSPDTTDQAMHLTVANLFTNLHRRIEADTTYEVLMNIMRHVPDCVVHPPLSAASGLLDEGAANHMRFAPAHGAPGLHVFVYGADGSLRDPPSARQTLNASRAVCRQHRIPEPSALFLRQNPSVISQGVFHNDVIAVNHLNVLLMHEEAFDEARYAVDSIRERFNVLHPAVPFVPIVVRSDELSVEEAVHTYFFNSQLVSLEGGGMALIAPYEVVSLYEGKAYHLMQRMCEEAANPIQAVHVVDLRQSMRNGGGPACLRLRVPMSETQRAALCQYTRVMADESTLVGLEQVISRHYPDTLTSQSLSNPLLLEACRNALDGFSEVLRIPL